MIECVLAWMFLFVGVATHNPMHFIVSALYAIASNIARKVGDQNSKIS